ncbi:MAG: hypothetical protein ACOCXG_02005 [Nanoarchaeota archaeon]
MADGYRHGNTRFDRGPERKPEIYVGFTVLYRQSPRDFDAPTQKNVSQRERGLPSRFTSDNE